MAKSISHDRKITIYPPSELKNLVVAECAIANLSYSDVVSRAIQDHYSAMPEDKLRSIQDKADKLASYPKKTA